MSESMYLGQTNISTDITINGKVKTIKIGLMPIIKRLFKKKIIDKSKNNKLSNTKADCHSLTKKNLHKAINMTGTEKKKRCGLCDAFSIL